jgi:hypothetical protein
MRVGPQIALLVHGIVGDPGIPLDTPDERTQEFRRDEELEVGLWHRSANPFTRRRKAYLLVDVTSRRTPSVNLVVTPLSIDGRLRVDGEITHLVHLGQLLIDHARLAGGGL